MLSLLCLIIWAILYYKYKGKITIQEKQQIDLNKKKIILNKIKQIEQEKIKFQGDIMTNIPLIVDNNYTNLSNHITTTQT
jgi:hypothetical protein